MKKYRAILLIGAPGSGKGTQGKALGTLPGFFHCACGNVFRSVDVRTDLGKIFFEYSRKGLLVPDEASVRLWDTYISDCEKNHTFKPELDYLVLDGIPRNATQAGLMASIVEVKKIFHFECPLRGELIKRLRKRALKENRLDDASEAVIQRRLEIYDEDAKSLLACYPRMLVHQVDALRRPHVVMNDILDCIIKDEYLTALERSTIDGPV